MTQNERKMKKKSNLNMNYIKIVFVILFKTYLVLSSTSYC